jgi:hypothetical protein
MTFRPLWIASSLALLAMTGDRGNEIVCPFLSPRAGRGETRGEMKAHIRSSALALPERIFVLSASESGTVCIHSIAGGFITNGQSTANRI